MLSFFEIELIREIVKAKGYTVSQVEDDQPDERLEARVKSSGWEMIVVVVAGRYDDKFTLVVWDPARFDLTWANFDHKYNEEVDAFVESGAFCVASEAVKEHNKVYFLQPK